jgi:ABC-type antimicrobial peptide transport system permease subunit
VEYWVASVATQVFFEACISSLAFSRLFRMASELWICRVCVAVFGMVSVWVVIFIQENAFLSFLGLDQSWIRTAYDDFYYGDDDGDDDVDAQCSESYTSLNLYQCIIPNIPMTIALWL